MKSGSAAKSTTSLDTSINMKKVFLFADGFRAYGKNREELREKLGGKGAGLAEMTQSGVRVPPGLTISTDACRDYYNENRSMPKGLIDEVLTELASIEQELGRKLGDPKTPLLLSVRSGAKFSMPGMMDTILNLGLNDQTVEGLARSTDNERFAWDSYRRFVQMYGNVVFDVEKYAFEDAIADLKARRRVSSDLELTTADLKELVATFKELVRSHRDIEFPEDCVVQLAGAIEAVFRSWNNDRAIYYRNLHEIDHQLGTAVTVQAMVFGNFDEQSATGVCFTRNPSTGAHELYGEFLLKAQGEDVVAGTRTPLAIQGLSEAIPNAAKELHRVTKMLEQHYRDMQDIEFTIERGELFLLQTRNAKRTAAAAVQVAVDLCKEGAISRSEALMRVNPNQLVQLLLPSFRDSDKDTARRSGALIAAGLNASPGAASGEIVFCPDEAEALAKSGRKVILVRIETCPDDIHGMVPAQGVVTSRGGMTSHAAVVARGMGKPCVAGCDALKIDLQKEELRVGERLFHKGDNISIDGTTGEIFDGILPTHDSQMSPACEELLLWADETRRLQIRTNADTPDDAKRARAFGAQGIGLCRTEHMFMESERLPVMQEMILSSTREEREGALEKLLPMQRSDFIGIFEAMDGLPVTIRLLDPPLHEFLPKHDELLVDVRMAQAGVSKLSNTQSSINEQLLRKVNELHESNPMMGLRGCRLGLVYPEINEMQVRAIIEAAVAVARRGVKVYPEIMIPLIGHVNELVAVKKQLEEVAKEVMLKEQISVPYLFGTMIEIPRACVVAGAIAEHAAFFSFGTNDLTQMTFGYSRDDAEGKFLGLYVGGREGDQALEPILPHNPFEVLDQEGVGKLMELAVAGGRKTRPELKIGICGEHGGEPRSIAFVDRLGFNYVSCSPFRVPIARLAAAQSVLTVELR